jgi:crossover junction endodeoxyribonuclease RusA
VLGESVSTIALRLPMPPSVNALYANVAGKGRVKSTRYRTWLNAAGWAIKEQRPRKVKGDYVLWIWAQRPDGRRRDLGNLEKPISDLLVAHGIVGDDSQCVAIHCYWSGSGRECEVRIEPAQAAVTARAA